MKRTLTVVVLFCGLVASASRVQAVVGTEWGVSVLTLGSGPDALQEQQALRDALELMGIPYVETADVENAARRPLVLIGGIPSNTQLTPGQREALYGYVERGGILLATQVQGNKFFPLFGLQSATTSRGNFRVQFTGDDPALRYLNRQEEKLISLGDPTLYSETVWSTQYTPSFGTDVLARYENGTGAVTRNVYGRGVAYAIGLGFKETTLIPQLARSFEAARRWINSFEPSGDVFRLLLRGVYEDAVHPFLLIHTVPEGKETALCLSHDVDARESFEHSLAFARMEAGLGVRSTFFVTTKYFPDDTDVAYYTPERIAWIRQVAAMGFEIGSHSVSHALTFDTFPLGSPQITLGGYDHTRPTLFGEAQVSKKLLDRDLHQETAGFRAGYLRYPDELIVALEHSGYTFDSSVSAQLVLTNFPYFGFRRRTLGSERSAVVVVPVTLDDSRSELKTRDFLTPDTQEEALRTWADVIRANGENNATSCLLIHPTDATYKLEVERRLITEHLRKNVWIGDVGSVARFWRHRERLRPVLQKDPAGAIAIVLNMTKRELPPGQTLVVEGREGGRVPKVLDAAGDVVAVHVRSDGDRHYLLLP